MDEAGGSLLRVTSGWVALAHDGRESFVPAGAAARAEPDGRLGAPYFEDASEKFQQALTRFDFGNDKTNAFATVLAEARARDALTLWHLLPRVDGNERERTYERLVALVPATKTLSKADTLRLDPATGVFSLLPDHVTTALRYSTTTLLGNGKALIAGGYGGEGLASAGAWVYHPEANR